MQEMVSMAVWLHGVSIMMLLSVIFWLIMIVQSKQDFIPQSKRYERVNLYYKALLGVLFFTGIVVMAVVKFAVSWMVYVMVFFTFIMIGSTLKEHMAYKSTSVKDISSQTRFLRYAKKKYISDVLIILIIGVSAYAVSL